MFVSPQRHTALWLSRTRSAVAAIYSRSGQFFLLRKRVRDAPGSSVATEENPQELNMRKVRVFFAVIGVFFAVLAAATIAFE
jgi:hypothetical protein